MKTIQELKEFHEKYVLKYVGKQTNKGVVEKIRYFNFIGANGGIWSDNPSLNSRGIIYGTINGENIPIGELKLI